MKYIYCPQCGRKLLEGEEGSSVQVKCTKCGLLVKASIAASEINLTVKGNSAFAKAISNN